ncbi:hypothetical protein A1356_18350 [Methylomonas koyamae]|uniref:Uncharacterized protein n=1 Tax=Methylomonas koyamae TaxID=702114 RepID=A0AA91DB09_9GAMM|nr:hypothetical protein A1356_18350 [Methylomonas koyamae]
MNRCKPSVKAALLLSAVALNAEAAARYNITDLGTLGGLTSSAAAINDLGQIVGTADTASGVNSAFIFSNGQMADLGNFGAIGAAPTAINNSGQIIGQLIDLTGPRGFLHTNGQLVDFGVNRFANGINNHGQVVGTEIVNGGFLYANGAYANLGLTASSNFHGINDSGQITGDMVFANNEYHAFFNSNGQVTDLGTLGGTFSSGRAINGVGQIAGISTLVGDDYAQMHAFLWDNGVMTDLGTLGGDSSHVNDINDAGEIVGDITAANGDLRPFLYANGTMADLNTLIALDSGWSLLSAAGINNSGQIVGSGINPEGYQRAFLLTPVAAVPLPAAIWLFGSALAGFSWTSGKRRIKK